MLVKFRFLLENDGANTLLGQSGRKSQANRPCPHDHHWDIRCCRN
jgi:hypothetical protein